MYGVSEHRPYRDGSSYEWGQFTEGRIHSGAILVSVGADPNAGKDSDPSLLHFAALCGSEDDVESLLVAGADLDARNRSGDTPLHHALFKNDAPMIEMLIAAGADVNTKNTNGNTPLHTILQVQLGRT